MRLSNYHTHTCYCDGQDSPEELVQEALRLGCPELGFSGHAHVSFDDCCMTPEGTEAYIREIRALQETYRDQIRIWLGIEQDYYSDFPTDPYEFVIGSVHYVFRDGEYLFVDESLERQQQAVNEHYGGDYYAMIEDYYATVAQIYDKTHCDIVGHFDLVCKYNENGDLFDPAHPRYRRAAQEAMEYLLQKPVLFEINTGAMARGYRTRPYPDYPLLRELEARGARLILSSDCHERKNLLFGLEALSGSVCGIQEKLYKNR